jgi:hypothetical protein
VSGEGDTEFDDSHKVPEFNWTMVPEKDALVYLWTGEGVSAFHVVYTFRQRHLKILEP